MDGGFTITLTPNSVAPNSVVTPGPGPALDNTTQAGFLEALARNLDGVSASPVAATVAPSVPTEATLPEIKPSWAGQAPVALNFVNGKPSAETLLAAHVAMQEPSGEASLVGLPTSGTDGPIGTVLSASGLATSPDADAIPNMVDIATPSAWTDQDSAPIETTDQSAATGDAIAGDVMNSGVISWTTMAEPSRNEAQMPTGASDATASLPPNVALSPSQPEIMSVPQQLLSPQLPAAESAPVALASAQGVKPGVQLQSGVLQDFPVQAASEAVDGKSVSLHLQRPSITPPSQPEGQGLLPELEVVGPDSVGPDSVGPDVRTLVAHFALRAPLRNAIPHELAPQVADAAPVSAAGMELSIMAPTTWPSGAPGVIARPPEATAPPPVRQLAQIAIALAFTSGAANGFNLTLDPVELGRVEIRVQREADGHSVRIVAERPETLALLQRDRHELDRSLTDAGLRVASNGIDFSLGNSGPGQDAPPEEGAPRSKRSGGGTAELKAEPSPARATRGLLDLNI